MFVTPLANKTKPKISFCPERVHNRYRIYTPEAQPAISCPTKLIATNPKRTHDEAFENQKLEEYLQKEKGTQPKEVRKQTKLISGLGIEENKKTDLVKGKIRKRNSVKKHSVQIGSVLVVRNNPSSRIETIGITALGASLSMAISDDSGKEIEIEKCYKPVRKRIASKTASFPNKERERILEKTRRILREEENNRKIPNRITLREAISNGIRKEYKPAIMRPGFRKLTKHAFEVDDLHQEQIRKADYIDLPNLKDIPMKLTEKFQPATKMAQTLTLDDDSFIPPRVLQYKSSNLGDNETDNEKQVSERARNPISPWFLDWTNYLRSNLSEDSNSEGNKSLIHKQILGENAQDAKQA